MSAPKSRGRNGKAYRPNEILVIDVGGTNVKIAMGHHKEQVKIPSGAEMTATQMATAVKKAAADWGYEAVSIGFPGPVKGGAPAKEPVNLGKGWVRFDYAKAFGKPVRIINDAALQALGGYEGGRMLFLGLGTGLGSTLIVDGAVAPLEVAHMPYRKGRSYEDYVGQRGLDRMGKKKWAKHVEAVIAILLAGLQAEYAVLGGGNTRKLEKLPPGVKPGTNANAIRGGVRLWDR
jgi:predicted NBD/HSP70 family sugar kinase